MSTKLGKYFTLAEMTRSDIATRHKLSNSPNGKETQSLQALVQNILDPLRESVGTINVTSGFRSRAVNAKAGGSSTSQHVLGEAADINVSGMTSDALVRRIISLGLPFDQVIEEFGSWVHVSYGPRNRRQALRAVKVNGKTVYQPFA